MRYIGIMSGTSCDGIDVVLVDFNHGFELIATGFEPFPDSVKQELLSVIANQAVCIQSLGQLDAKLGHLYAQAANNLLNSNKLDAESITAIGLHGQTIYHQAEKNPSEMLCNTLQLGSAAITAQLTGIITVANFRQMDLAHGGQGAPLAPILHQQLFKQADKQVVVLNLGGIANITLLNNEGVLGFDTGPASCLMDEFINAHQGLPFDQSGQWAQQGKVNQALLNDLCNESYLSQPFPKSTGRELFNLKWLQSKLCNHPDILPVDIQRTLLQFTVASVAMGIEQTGQVIDEVVVCGGGTHNIMLFEQLAEKLDCPVFSSEHYGINPDYIEAMLMAWLAQQNINQNKLDLRSITGTQMPLIYGVMHNPNCG